ncbi:hypothetical protein [Kineococcus sp. NPDC059986]|uniref:hypothetical protein n=1 Tax=Kineococcus sp. NPDC059986 TaxID=3155538 RepID=UPI00344FE30A
MRDRFTGEVASRSTTELSGGVLQGAAQEVEFGGVEAVAEGVEAACEVLDVVAVESSRRQGEEVVQGGHETREGVGGPVAWGVLDGGGHVFKFSRTGPVSEG